MQTLENYLVRMSNNGLKATTLENARNTIRSLILFKKWTLSGSTDSFDEYVSQYSKGKTQEVRTHELGTVENLESIQVGDIDQFLFWLMKNRTNGTLNNRKIYIKKFFTDNECPELVKHINVNFNKKIVDKSEVLTVDDVNRLIEGCDSFLYQTVIACLYESGGRINEVLSIKKSELVEDIEGHYRARMHTTKTSGVSGKDYRDTQFIDSAPYIRRLLMYDSAKSDRLFNIQHLAVANHIKEVAKKVGIDKRVNPHAFRHAKATSMVQEGYTEPIIKKKLGWQPDSRMMGRYTHNDDEDVMDIERAKKLGLSPDKIISVRHIAQPKKSIVENLQSKIAQQEEANKALMEKMASLEMSEEKIIERLMQKFPALAQSAD